MKRTKQNDDNFIMLPMVDFCFKELMRNPKVRKGFIAAVLGKKPEEIRNTNLIPTELRKESEDDKLGILDFIHFSQDKKCFRKLAFCDVETGEQYTDLMEMYVLELKKLPPEDLNEKGIIRWMRFLGGKNREEFEDMAKKDEYIEEAYNELKKLSHDEQMRMEYELRQKAIRDHNMMMKTARKEGYEMGERAALKKVIDKLTGDGRTIEETAELLGLGVEMVEEISKGY